MKRTFIGALSLLAMAGSALPAFAGNDPVYQVTVDYIAFTVFGARGKGEPAHHITFDVRSVEATQDGLWYPADLNDDGEIAYIDSVIYVFDASPNREKVGAFRGVNDDSFDNLGSDGSLYGFDSYLGLDLVPGDYVMAISNYDFSEDEARSGINLTDTGPFTLETDPAEDWSNFDHGDYHVRASDDFRGATVFEADGTIYLVPAPATGLVIGLAGIAAARRRR